MTIFPFMAPKKLWNILKRSISDFIDEELKGDTGPVAGSEPISIEDESAVERARRRIRGDQAA